MIAIAFDRRRPDLWTPLSGKPGKCKTFAVRRERARPVQGLAVRQPLRFARSVRPDPVHTRTGLEPGFEDNVLAIGRPHRLDIGALERGETRGRHAREVPTPDV